MNRYQKHSEFFNAVYDEEYKQSGPHGTIQWKGTDVCIDLHCTCGYHGHIDSDFFYHYECSNCGAKYAVGIAVKLIPLTYDQAKYVEEDGGGFKRDDQGRIAQEGGGSVIAIQPEDSDGLLTKPNHSPGEE